jgi:hypothetical protein
LERPVDPAVAAAVEATVGVRPDGGDGDDRFFPADGYPALRVFFAVRPSYGDGDGEDRFFPVRPADGDGDGEEDPFFPAAFRVLVMMLRFVVMGTGLVMGENKKE